MARIEKRVQVNFQTNPELLEKAKKVIKAHNLDMSKSLNLFLETIVATESLPILREDELEKERIFAQLQAEVAESLAEYRSGGGISLEEAKKAYGL